MVNTSGRYLVKETEIMQVRACFIGDADDCLAVNLGGL